MLVARCIGRGTTDKLGEAPFATPPASEYFSNLWLQGMSAAEATEAFGDRIRRAPAVVNAAQSKSKGSSKRPARAAGAAAGRAAGFATDVAKNGDVGDRGGDAAPSNVKAGCATTTRGGDGGMASSFSNGSTSTGDAAATATVNGGATTVVAAGSSDGDAQEAGADGGGGKAARCAAVGRIAGCGPYQPRTSGRGVGGSLRKRFTDDQVRLDGGACNEYQSPIVVRSFRVCSLLCTIGHRPAYLTK